MRVEGQVRSPYAVETPPAVPTPVLPGDMYAGSVGEAAPTSLSRKKKILSGCLAGVAVLGLGGAAIAHQAGHLNPYPYSCGSTLEQAGRDAHESNPELRDIKNLKDESAKRVDFQHVVDTTIEQYRHEYGVQPHHQTRLTRTRGIGPEEFRVFRITAHAETLRAENDGDYHLVFKDDQGHALITESPAPGDTCGSPYFDQMKQGREQMDQLFGKISQPLQDKDLHGELVTVTGVGFWDSGTRDGWTCTRSCRCTLRRIR